MTTISAQPDPLVVEDLVRRIVNAVHPLRIILFGSAARSTLGPDSDIDVMVVMPEGTHRLNTARYLYQQMMGLHFPVDILVTTPADLEEHKDNIGLIYRTILAEGKEVYVS